MPPQFAYPAALGDLLAAILAFVAFWAVKRNSTRSRPLILAFSLVGSIDLVAAITLATIYEVDAYMGAAYWIPAFWVPVLLVTHNITFVILRRHRAAFAGPKPVTMVSHPMNSCAVGRGALVQE